MPKYQIYKTKIPNINQNTKMPKYQNTKYIKPKYQTKIPKCQTAKMIFRNDFTNRKNSK